MLFRADFVRQKHVPGSIETNHGSLSKIIGAFLALCVAFVSIGSDLTFSLGQCWRQLPFDEKRFWEVKARAEKAKHKAMYPLYRFRPVHKKKQGAADDVAPPLDDPANKRKEKQPTTEEDERRCDAVAQLLLEGKKGEELAQAVRNLDRERELHREMEMGYLGFGPTSRRNSYDMELGYDSRGPSPMLSAASSSSAASSLLHMPLPMYVPPSNFYGMNMNFPRRPSSVPLPIPDFFASYSAPGIAIPSLPSLSRPASPVGSIARHTQQQQQQQHQGFLHPFHNPFDDATPTTNDFSFNAPHAPSPQYAQQAFAPFVQPSAYPSSTLPFGLGGMYTPNSQRSSLGLGHRRASSAQAMLMRSWTMPIMSGSEAVPVQLERDHSPLPDVEAGLFDDFSFGGGVSVSGSMSPTGVVEGEVMNHGGEGVDPMGDVAPPVDPVTSSSTTPSMQHASPLYSGSPPNGVVGLPDGMHFGDHAHHALQDQHQHQQHQHQHQHQHHHLGMEEMLDMGMSAYGMYADVDPIERSIGVEGGMKSDGYFEGVNVGVGGGYEV